MIPMQYRYVVEHGICVLPTDQQEKTVVCKTADWYQAEDGTVVRYEYDSKAPNGNRIHAWVMRKADGAYVDHSQYRHDVIESNGYNLVVLKGQ